MTPRSDRMRNISGQIDEDLGEGITKLLRENVADDDLQDIVKHFDPEI